MAQGLLKVSEAVSSVSPTETETFLVVHVHSLIPLCFVLVDRHLSSLPETKSKGSVSFVFVWVEVPVPTFEDCI